MTGLIVPGIDGRSIGSSIGSNASSERLCTSAMSDAFTQTSDDENKVDDNKVMMVGVTIDAPPISAVYLPTNNDLELCESLRVEIQAIEREEKEKAEKLSAEKAAVNAGKIPNGSDENPDATTCEVSYQNSSITEELSVNEASGDLDANDISD